MTSQICLILQSCSVNLCYTASLPVQNLNICWVMYCIYFYPYSPSSYLILNHFSRATWTSVLCPNSWLTSFLITVLRSDPVVVPKRTLKIFPMAGIATRLRLCLKKISTYFNNFTFPHFVACCCIKINFSCLRLNSNSRYPTFSSHFISEVPDFQPHFLLIFLGFLWLW